jgi:hypothetical protein
MADPISSETKALTKQTKAFTLPAALELSAMNAQLGGVPGVSEFPSRRAELKTSTDVSTEQEKQLGRLSEVEAPIMAAQQAGKQYEADVQSAVATQSREQAQDIEAGLDLVREQFPYPQFKPTQENMQSIATLFSLVGMIGVAMGGAGKMSAMGSLNAMTGMMNGWQKGRKDMWEKEKVEFDKNMAKTKSILDDAYKDADRAYKTLAYNREEAAALAGQSAAKLGSQVAKQILEKQGIERYISYLDGVKKDLRHAEDLASQEKRDEKRVEAQIAREKANFAQQDKLAREREAAAERRLGIRLEAAGARRDEKALQSIGPALRSIAEQYPDGTANTLVGASPDDKKRIQGAFRAVEESENTADFVARNPRAVGALAAAKNFLKVDSIKSFQNDDEGAVVAAKAAEIDRQLDAGVQKGLISKDDAEAAKVLQKRLFGLALSDVQGSGQRGSVYLDKQFQNLYDQSSRANTLLKIIRERAEENNRNLKIYKLNVERNEMPERFPLIEASTQESFDKYIKNRAPAAPVVPEKVTAALKGKSDGYKAEYQGKKYIVRNGQIVEQ